MEDSHSKHPQLICQSQCKKKELQVQIHGMKDSVPKSNKKERKQLHLYEAWRPRWSRGPSRSKTRYKRSRTSLTTATSMLSLKTPLRQVWRTIFLLAGLKQARERASLQRVGEVGRHNCCQIQTTAGIRRKGRWPLSWGTEIGRQGYPS
jgi:hypothetical protein